MRRILKEVKPLSPDQLLNEILSSRVAQGKSRSSSPAKPDSNRRLSTIQQQPRPLGFLSSPNLKKLAGVSGEVKNYLNSPVHKPTPLPLPKEDTLPYALKGALAEIKEMEEISEGADVTEGRQSRRLSSHNKTANSQPNSQRQSSKESKNDGFFAARPMEGEKEWRTLRLKTQLKKRESAITSMNQGLPDDFVHVKKFSNLDTRHQCSASAAQSEGDMSDESRPASRSTSPRQKKEEEESRPDLDSIFQQSMQQMLEETPNEIIFNHKGYSKTLRRRVSSSVRENEASDFENPVEPSFEDKPLRFDDFEQLPLGQNDFVLKEEPKADGGFGSFELFCGDPAGQALQQPEMGFSMTPLDLQTKTEVELESPKLKAKSRKPRTLKISKNSKPIQKLPTDNNSMKSIESLGSLQRKKQERAFHFKSQKSQVGEPDLRLESAPTQEAADVSMRDEEDMQSQKFLNHEEGQSNMEAHPEQTDASRLNYESHSIGPLTVLERQRRILKFFERKRQNFGGKKFTYECRKQVAEKRLRIKGRFVTKQQAFEILGLQGDEQNTNEQLQKLLEQHYNINQSNTLPYTSHIAQIMHIQLSKQSGTLQPAHPQQANSFACRPMIQVNSLVHNENGSKLVKVRNFQTLFQPAGEDVQMEPEVDDSCPSSSIKHVAENINLAALAERADESYKSQQESVVRLLAALQKQEQKSMAQLENYIQPLFRVERVEATDLE